MANEEPPSLPSHLYPSLSGCSSQEALLPVPSKEEANETPTAPPCGTKLPNIERRPPAHVPRESTSTGARDNTRPPLQETPWGQSQYQREAERLMALYGQPSHVWPSDSHRCPPTYFQQMCKARDYNSQQYQQWWEEDPEEMCCITH